MDVSQSELLSELTSDLAQDLLPDTIFVGTEAVVGFLANVFVFYMFVFHHESSNYRMFVLFLAFIDFVCTMTTMPGEIIGHRFWYEYPSKYICKTKVFFNLFTLSAETFCLLLISIERKRLVLSEELRMGRKQALRYCLLAYLIAAILAAPAPVCWGLRTYTTKYNNQRINVTICEKDEAYADTKFTELYQISVGCILTLLLLITIFQYVNITKVLRTLPADIETVPIIRRETKIFLFITGAFFVTTILYFTMISILGSSKDTVDGLSNKRKVTFFFFLRIYFIHHVMNPFIYGVSNTEIRYRIKNYLCMSCRSSDEYIEIE